MTEQRPLKSDSLGSVGPLDRGKGEAVPGPSASVGRELRAGGPPETVSKLKLIVDQQLLCRPYFRVLVPFQLVGG